MATETNTQKNDTLSNDSDTPSNDIADLNNDRIDNLAALITVTAEQMDDRLRAGELLEQGAHRTDELITAVFGGSAPSIENYLAARQDTLQAA